MNPAPGSSVGAGKAPLVPSPVRLGRTAFPPFCISFIVVCVALRVELADRLDSSENADAVDTQSESLPSLSTAGTTTPGMCTVCRSGRVGEDARYSDTSG